MSEYLSTTGEIKDAAKDTNDNMKNYYDLTNTLNDTSGALTEAGEFSKSMGKLSAGLGMLGAGLGVASIVINLIDDSPSDTEQILTAIAALSTQMEEFEENMVKQFANLSELVVKESAISQIEESVNYLLGVKDLIDLYMEKSNSEDTQDAANQYASDLKSIDSMNIYWAVNDIKQNLTGGYTNTNILKAYYNSTNGETAILYTLGKDLFDLAGFALSADCLIMGLKCEYPEDDNDFQGLKVSDIESREEEYERLFLEPIYKEWQFWVNECIVNYAYDTISWRDSDKYDEGSFLSVAMDNKGNVVEISCGSSNGKHYYRVGKVFLDSDSIATNIIWGDSHQFDSGTHVSVAMDNNGNVVYVECGSTNKHYYRIGRVDFNNKTISWGDSHKFDTGTHVSVAMDNDGNVVVINRGSSDNKNHYYRVGKANFNNKTITWGDIIQFDTGSYVSVAMDNSGNVVYIECGSTNKLYYRVGRANFNNKTIAWGDSYQFDTGSFVSVAMNDNGNVVVISCGTPSNNKHYYRNGKVDFNNKTITWRDFHDYDTGDDLSIAMGEGRCWPTADSGGDTFDYVVEVSRGTFLKSNYNNHYYRLGHLIHNQ